MTCCPKPSHHTERYLWPLWVRDGEPQVQKVNRVCLNCGTHWAGTDGEEVRYSRKEWDILMEDTFKEGGA